MKNLILLSIILLSFFFALPNRFLIATDDDGGEMIDYMITNYMIGSSSVTVSSPNSQTVAAITVVSGVGEVIIYDGNRQYLGVYSLSVGQEVINVSLPPQCSLTFERTQGTESLSGTIIFVNN